MKLKRVFCGILCVMLLVVMSGCGNSTSSEKADTKKSSVSIEKQIEEDIVGYWSGEDGYWIFFDDGELSIVDKTIYDVINVSYQVSGDTITLGTNADLTLSDVKINKSTFTFVSGGTKFTLTAVSEDEVMDFLENAAESLRE